MQKAARFRKKPVVIEAMPFDGSWESGHVILVWMGRADSGVVWMEHDGLDGQRISIHTLEGTMTASPGDWVIKGVSGEFYPCKPDIFEATYEPE
jgi:hypothetical protein